MWLDINFLTHSSSFFYSFQMAFGQTSIRLLGCWSLNNVKQEHHHVVFFEVLGCLQLSQVNQLDCCSSMSPRVSTFSHKHDHTTLCPCADQGSKMQGIIVQTPLPIAYFRHAPFVLPTSLHGTSWWFTILAGWSVVVWCSASSPNTSNLEKGIEFTWYRITSLEMKKLMHHTK